MGLGGVVCSAVVTAATGPDSLSWPHLYSSSQRPRSALSWPRTRFSEPKLPASSIQSRNTRCTRFSGEDE